MVTSKKQRFTVEQYLKMDRTGVFGHDRVELILGRIYRMHAQNYSHRDLVTRLSELLLPRFPTSRYWTVIQGTLPLGKYGAPDPDFHILDVPRGTPEHLLPLPFLIIEVADTTYRRDSGVKLRQYANAGVQDYWIVNVSERRVEIYRQPVGQTEAGRPGYLERFDRSGDGLVAPLRYPDFEVRVDDIFL